MSTTASWPAAYSALRKGVHLAIRCDVLKKTYSVSNPLLLPSSAYEKEIRAETHGVSHATFNEEVVTNYLKENGFDTELTHLNDAGMYLLAVTSPSGGWHKGSHMSEISVNGISYRAGHVDKKGCEFFWSPSHTHPVASIKTGLSEVYITNCPLAPSTYHELFLKGMSIAGEFEPEKTSTKADFWGVTYPLAFVEDTPEIPELDETTTIENTHIKGYAQRNRLNLTWSGLSNESPSKESPVKMTRDHGNTLVINQPFLLIFKRQWVSVPDLVAHVTEEDWKQV